MNKRCLLVVDDQPEIGEFIKNAAEPLGFSVCVTSDSAQFMKLYEKVDPDTIVMDICMPDCDGFELLHQLAAAHCAARILVVSGSEELMTHDEFFLRSAVKLATDFGLLDVGALKKPLRLAELRAFLNGGPAPRQDIPTDRSVSAGI